LIVLFFVPEGAIEPSLTKTNTTTAPYSTDNKK